MSKEFWSPFSIKQSVAKDKQQSRAMDEPDTDETPSEKSNASAKLFVKNYDSNASELKDES